MNGGMLQSKQVPVYLDRLPADVATGEAEEIAGKIQNKVGQVKKVFGK